MFIISDGWCQQGGIPKTATNGGWEEITVTLHRSYRDTNYIVKVNGNWSDAASSSATITEKKINSFKCILATNNATQLGWWEAGGYIK